MSSNDILEQDTSQSSKERKFGELIRDFLCLTLGKEFFTLCTAFFMSVWNSGAPYKVFMARRCMNLMYLFYQSSETCKDKDLEETFFSDQALLSNAREIVDCYEKIGFIPRILIIDEIMLHGRTINVLIERLTDRICECLIEDDIKFNRRKVENDVLSAVSIRVIMQSSEGILLDRKLWSLLRAEEVCDLQRLHQFSSSVSMVIADGVVTNTSFVPSLRIDTDENGQEIYKHLSQKADSLMLISPFQGKSLEKVWIYPLVTPDGNVKALYTLRVVSSSIDGAKRLIPFIILSDIREFKDDLFCVLDDDTRLAAENAYRFWGKEAPAWIDALIMIMSQNILLLLLEGSKIENLDSNIDYDKIRMSFRSRRSKIPDAFYDTIQDRKNPWLSWRDMGNILLKLTQDSVPLFSLGTVHISNLFYKQRREDYEYRIRKSISDLITEYAYEEELRAHKQYIRESYPTGRKTTPRAMSEILDDLNRNIEPIKIYKEDFLIYAVAVILQYMDIGALAVTVRCLNSNYEKKYRNLCNVGEQALFILPMRYYQYLNVLEVMERESQRDIDRLVRTIRLWFFDQIGREKTENLISFVYKLYSIGHHVKDWNIDLSGWIGWDPSIMNESKTRLDEIASQSKELYKYLKR